MEDEATSGERGGVQAMETGLALLMAMTRRRGAQMLKTLADDADMPPAKAHRYLVSLIRAGIVTQESDTGRYRLGNGALQLGLAVMADMDVVDLGFKALPALRDDVEETVGLIVWAQHGPTFVKVLESDRHVSVNSRAGSTMPLLTSASGQVFLCFLPRTTTASFVRKELSHNAKEARRDAPTAQAEVDELIARTRRHGLGRVTGEYFRGIGALSAPVFDVSGQLVAAMTVLGPESAMDLAWNGQLATRLKAHARKLSEALGHGQLPPS